jgi:hypothetical protein
VPDGLPDVEHLGVRRAWAVRGGLLRAALDGRAHPAFAGISMADRRASAVEQAVAAREDSRGRQAAGDSNSVSAALLPVPQVEQMQLLPVVWEMSGAAAWMEASLLEAQSGLRVWLALPVQSGDARQVFAQRPEARRA